MTGRLLWPDLEPDVVQEGWLAELPLVTTADVLTAIARRHPDDGYGGAPGRWVFLREVQASTGAYSEVQRFDAIAIGLVPSVGYARVIYEVKVSRSDWLRELKPIPDVRWTYNGHERRLGAGESRVVVKRLAREGGEELTRDSGLGSYRVAGERRKWEEALALSTEFYFAAPPRCVLEHEVPPEAGLVEIRPWGADRELRPRVIRKAPVRDTPNPDAGFWSSILRRAAQR